VYPPSSTNENVNKNSTRLAALNGETWPNVWPDMQLGNGLISAQDQPLNQSCISNFTVDPPQALDDRRYRAYYYSDKMNARRTVEIHAGGNFDFGLVESEFDATIDSMDSYYSERHYLVIDLTVKVMQQGITTTDAICKGWDNSERDLNNFIHDCGDRYLSSRIYGGHVFIYMNLANISEQHRDEIEATLKVGALSGSLSTDIRVMLDKGAVLDSQIS
jgi:hypothetical protein